MRWQSSFNYLLCNYFLLLNSTQLFASEADSRNSEASRQPHAAAAAAGSKLKFLPPKLPDGAYFVQHFPGPGTPADHQLVVSQSKKDEGSADADGSTSKYDGQWSVEVPASSAVEGDYALVMKSPARHYAISAKLSRPFEFDSAEKQLVVQYEVKFQHGVDCGGAYLKLLTAGEALDLANFNDKTPYTIMFGPDKCGREHKLHFILRHRSPLTGLVEEKHAKKPAADLSAYFTDKRTHLYTLVVNSNNQFQVYVDRILVNNGSLLEHLEPPINPPAIVDDPYDEKPADWDDREKIPDPKAVRPADWDETQPEFVEDAKAVMPAGWLLDEPPTVPDPAAGKPPDWDDDMDGAWEPARVPNPKCKDAPGCGPWIRPKVKNPLHRGKWTPPLVDNPAYKGSWKPRQIPNPDRFVDREPWRFAPIGAVGLELWSVTDGAAFDNFLIVDRKQLADDFAEQTWAVKRQAERQSDWALQSVIDALANISRDRPWIWAALLVGVALPLVLLIAYCCCLRESGAAAAAAASRARHKKTDGDVGGDRKASLESDGDDYNDDDDDLDDLVDEAPAAEAAAEADYEDSDDEPPELVDLDAPDDEPPVGLIGEQEGPRKRTSCARKE